MVLTDSRSTRIAVFIDFDNVEIGVKNTIGGQFDIGLVLEAIKERGEIVTKIAYSDWKRAGDYSRVLTQHAIRMVQRNVTPGGDKNGADITMALDALEMAFTHDHINAFVIVGGDSDFISLVEKLKQYGRTVIVVGGRQFTSVTMQKNCHEFIAYENLVGTKGPGRSADRRGKRGAASDISKVLPLVKRALTVLSEREVTPQLGVLKSTLLQLDSTFSEREYGASSFRDFMEKVAETGAVMLRESGRSLLVEAREDADTGRAGLYGPPDAGGPQGAALQEPVNDFEEAPASPTLREPQGRPEQGRGAMSHQDGIRACQQAFIAGGARWPMYVRQARQFLRGAIDGFDERKYGFANVDALLRAAAKDGVLRLDRDRRGAPRFFAGPKMTSAAPAAAVETAEVVEAAVEEIPEVAVSGPVATEAVEEPPIVEAETVDAPPPPSRRRKTTGTKRKTAPAKAARTRARKTSKAKAEAADRD